MGVMSCSRNGCGNIMCDMYVDGVGYVCNEYQNEFHNYLEKNDIQVEYEGEIKKELKKFMESEKSYYEKGEKMDSYEFFSKRSR